MRYAGTIIKPMTEISYIKSNQGLIPSGEEDWEKHNRIKLGALVKANFTETRNPGFHRKFFSMLDVGFDAWTPGELEKNYGNTELNLNK